MSMRLKMSDYLAIHIILVKSIRSKIQKILGHDKFCFNDLLLNEKIERVIYDGTKFKCATIKGNKCPCEDLKEQIDNNGICRCGVVKGKKQKLNLFK